VLLVVVVEVMVEPPAGGPQWCCRLPKALFQMVVVRAAVGEGRGGERGRL
jgi:hypothetical protein